MAACDTCVRLCTCLVVIVSILVGFGLKSSKRELLDAVKQTTRRTEFQMHSRKTYLLRVVNGNELSELEQLKELLERTPEPQREELANAIDVDGTVRKSALFLACLNRSPKLVELLLWANANVTMGRLDEGTTPLHLAAGWKHSEDVLDLLLASRDRAGVMASVRAKPTSGGLRMHTPVYWASFYKYPLTGNKIIRWMRDSGWLYDEAEDRFEIDQSQAWKRLAADY